MSAASVNIIIADKIFYPGENVKGSVQVTITKENTIKAIELKAKGRAEVRWSEGTGDDKKDYWKIEKYYKHKFTIWRRDKSQPLLSVGTHHFEFNYRVPPNVPASFDSVNGYVKHFCKAAVDIANKIFDVKREVIISVGSLYDLNYNEEAKNQILLSKDKTICCWCCKGGSLSLTLNVDHSGYVPGEHIVINAECSNKSNSSTTKTIVELIQRVTCRDGASKCVENHVICSKSHPGIGPGMDDVWSGEKLIVPPLPPSGLSGCTIIDVVYILRFSISPGFPSRDLKVEAPIVIGTVPLRHLFGNFVNRSFESPSNQVEPIWFHCHDKTNLLNCDEDNVPLSISAFPWTQIYPDLALPLIRRFTEDWFNDYCKDTLANAQINKPKRESHQVTPLYVCYKQNF